VIALQNALPIAWARTARHGGLGVEDDDAYEHMPQAVEHDLRGDRASGRLEGRSDRARQIFAVSAPPRMADHMRAMANRRHPRVRALWRPRRFVETELAAA